MNKLFKTNYYKHSTDDDKLWIDDLLNRKESAIILTRLLENVETPFSLIINSSWGTGKTFFFERWHKEISKKHFAVYFNAWESEISPNTILSFLEAVKKEKKKDGNFYSQLDEKIDNLKKRIISILPTIGTLSLLAGHPEIEAIIAPLYSLLKMVASEDNTNIDVASIREEFEEIVTYIINILEKDKNSDRSKKEPIFIFIDELDRCRPDFAIRFLEYIKHFFSVKGIIFVLALDLNQLEISIKHIYGENINCEGYLRKFINQFYNLPPLTRSFYAKKLFEGYKRTSSLIGDLNVKDLIDLFGGLSELFDLSLRDMEAVFSKFNMLSTISDEKTLFPAIVLYYICIQIKHPEAWNKFISNKKLKKVVNCFEEKSNYRSWDYIKNYVSDYIYRFYYITLFDDKKDKNKYKEDYKIKEEYIEKNRGRLTGKDLESYLDDARIFKEIYDHYEVFGEKQVDFVEFVGNAFSYSLDDPEPQPGIYSF